VVIRRNLRDDRIRETIIVARRLRLILPDQFAFLRRLCTEEPGWIDWALAQLGITGGMSSLLTEQATIA
jgi:hypothetical protein